MGSKENNPDRIRYGMLGEDTMSQDEKLDKYTGVVDWQYIKPHFESDALLYVDPALSITEVGKALSEDAKETIAAWLSSGDLLKPGKLHAQWWQENPQKFTALVVRPFVLIQPVNDPD